MLRAYQEQIGSATPGKRLYRAVQRANIAHRVIELIPQLFLGHR